VPLKGVNKTSSAKKIVTRAEKAGFFLYIIIIREHCALLVKLLVLNIWLSIAYCLVHLSLPGNRPWPRQVSYSMKVTALQRLLALMGTDST
jgi:hypothetical protein